MSIIDKVNLEIVNDNDDVKDIVRKGILLDDEHTCFYGFHSLFEIIWSIINNSIIYNATINNEQIGMVMVSNYEQKEDELELGMCLKKEYRNKGIGYYLLNTVINDCFLNNASAIHAVVRTDNNASIKLCNKLNFNRYEDDKTDFCYKNKKVKQAHFVIKKEEN